MKNNKNTTVEHDIPCYVYFPCSADAMRVTM